MSTVKQSDRSVHDLSSLIFTAGKIGRLQTLATHPVIAGDSYENTIAGSLRLASLRRGLAVDSKVDIISFFVPHRHIYGDEWTEFLKNGIQSTPLQATDVALANRANFLAVKNSESRTYPKWLRQGYKKIHDNYFKFPWGTSIVPEAFPITTLDADLGDFGAPVCHLKNIWSSPLPPEREAARFYTPEANNTIDIMELNNQYAMLHTDEERSLFMQRYRDVVKGFGGSTHYEADERPHMLMRSEFWASGYDVDGTDQTSLGQFSGRVQQAFSHKIPRFFVPEHGTIWTVACVRFPPTHTREQHYLIQNPNSTYAQIAGDPVINANMPPQKLKPENFFDGNSGSDTNRMAWGQWYREHPDHVHPLYEDVDGFPFLSSPQAFNELALYAQSLDYDGMFQTDQLGHWNMQARSNCTVMRSMPSTRDSAMTS